MAHDFGEALSSEDCEAPRMKNKRRFAETVNRNWYGGETGARPVPSCSNVRPPLTEFDLAKQSIVDIVTKSLAKFKRPRMEEAAEDQSEPVRSNGLDLGAAFANDNFRCVHNQPAEETLPMHHQQFHQGAQFCNQGGSKQPEKIDVPNLKASAGGAGVVGAFDIDGVKMTNDKVSKKMFAVKVSCPPSAQTSNFEINIWEGSV